MDRDTPYTFEPVDRTLIAEAYRLLNVGDPAAALRIITERRRQLSAGTDIQAAIARMAYGALLIDIGAASFDAAVIEEGLSTIEEQAVYFGDRLDGAVHQYNLGNARKSIFDVRRRDPGFVYNLEAIELLTAAKNHYLRAFKLFRAAKRTPTPTLWVNLANVLDQSSRNTEAILWYDRALANRSNFGMAHLNRASALEYIPRLTGVVTLNLLAQALRHYEAATRSKRVPAPAKRHAAERVGYLLRKIESQGHTVDSIEAQHNRLEEEQDGHSAYRRFCLDLYLALSEHALYCRCAGARRDDLSIATSARPIAGHFVGAMELLLNRMKSEFAFARVLFFQATAPKADPDVWSTEAFEGTFTELFEFESIGLYPEMLRTSFRLCFGVLDKIAYGVCELFGLATPGESIYFNSFWRKTRARNFKQADRWKNLNDLRNPSLIALYSQATDLDSTSGEWKEFKAWRNALEHNLLVLAPTSDSLGPLVEAKPLERLLVVPADDFVLRTLELLQLTAAAIFNFAFCVRCEGRKGGTEPSETLASAMLTKKPIGPK